MQDGVYIYRKPCTPTATHPFVIPGDTGLLVSLLVSSSPKQDLLGVSEMASYADYMKIWSEVTGVKSEVRQISVEDADREAPGGIGREAAESAATSAEFGWGDQLVLPWQVSCLSRLAPCTGGKGERGRFVLMGGSLIRKLRRPV